MRPAIAAMGLALLAGCAAPGKGPGGATVAPAAAVPGAAGLPARGEADFTVRTLARAPSGLDLEVRGVACEASSGGAVARFVSPARVVLPDTGQGIAVSCAGGGRSGAAQVEARQTFRAGPLRASPSIGISVGTGGRVGTGLGVGLSPVAIPDGVAYDDVRVVLR